jgi:hypothetical protein
MVWDWREGGREGDEGVVEREAEKLLDKSSEELRRKIYIGPEPPS